MKPLTSIYSLILVNLGAAVLPITAQVNVTQEHNHLNQNGFEGLPLPERVTHPRTHGFPDATFDFIFAKGLKGSHPTITQTNTSDHWPVTRDFRLR